MTHLVQDISVFPAMPCFKLPRLCILFSKFWVTFWVRVKNFFTQSRQVYIHLALTPPVFLLSSSCRNKQPFSGHCSNLLSNATEVQKTWRLFRRLITKLHLEVPNIYKLQTHYVSVFSFETWPFVWNLLIVNICHSRKLFGTKLFQCITVNKL